MTSRQQHQNQQQTPNGSRSVLGRQCIEDNEEEFLFELEAWTDRKDEARTTSIDDLQAEILFDLGLVLARKDYSLASASTVLEDTLELSKSAVAAALRIHRYYLATLVDIGTILERSTRGRGRGNDADHNNRGIVTNLSHIAAQNTKLCDALDDIGGVLVDAVHRLKLFNEDHDDEYDDGDVGDAG